MKNNVYFLDLLSPYIQKDLDTTKNIYDKSNFFVLNTFEYLIVGTSVGNGCALCSLKRYVGTKKDRTYISSVNKFSDYTYFAQRGQNNAIKLAINCLSSEEINNYAQKPLLFINKDTLEIFKSYLTPDPRCPWCGNLEDASYERATADLKYVLSFISSKTKTPLRSENANKLANRIESISLNSQIGIFNTLLDNFDGPFPVAVANLPIPNGNYEVGVGRTTNIETSRSIALIEGMERYAGFFPKGEKSSIVGRYCDIKDECIDIHSLILNEDSISQRSIYENKAFKFQENKKYHWIYANDVVNKKSLLIPEAYAYYGMTLLSHTFREEIIAYEISNGCAAGSNLSEAVFYGLTEIIERDAFLSAWYTDRPIKKILLDRSFFNKHKNLSESLQKFNDYYSDYKLDFFDISLDTELPVVLATATAKTIKKDKMNFMCAASCSISLSASIEASMQEISGIFFELQKKFCQNLDKIKELSLDMSKVNTMEQHSLVYGYYHNLHLIEFEKNATTSISATMLENNNNRFSDNLSEDIKKIIESFKKNNKAIFFVNQTTEEMKNIQMACVKVIVPGLLPMTFGAKNIRISRKRITELENYFNKKLSVRFVPHPFP